jgi:hypothetical protein
MPRDYYGQSSRNPRLPLLQDPIANADPEAIAMLAEIMGKTMGGNSQRRAGPGPQGQLQSELDYLPMESEGFRMQNQRRIRERGRNPNYTPLTPEERIVENQQGTLGYHRGDRVPPEMQAFGRFSGPPRRGNPYNQYGFKYPALETGYRDNSQPGFSQGTPPRGRNPYSQPGFSKNPGRTEDIGGMGLSTEDIMGLLPGLMGPPPDLPMPRRRMPSDIDRWRGRGRRRR